MVVWLTSGAGAIWWFASLCFFTRNTHVSRRAQPTRVQPFPAFIVCAAANMSATPPTPSPLGAISCSFLEGAGQGSSESETALPAPTLNSVLMTIPGVNQAPEAFNCAIFNVDQQFANGDPVQATFPGAFPAHSVVSRLLCVVVSWRGRKCTQFVFFLPACLPMMVQAIF